MGLYDYLIDVKLDCPYCGRGSIEIQTKDLDCSMSRYTVLYPEEEGLLGFLSNREAAHPGTKLRYVDGGATCSSALCDMLGRMKRLAKRGYIGWGGRSFDVRYRVDEKGFVVGPAEITEKDETTEAECIAAFRRKLQEDEGLNARFQEALERYHGDVYVALKMEFWEDTERLREQEKRSRARAKDGQVS